MSEVIEQSSVITASGPVSGVQVQRHMVEGPVALTVPLDMTIVILLMFMFAEQARRSPDDPPLNVTPETVLERLREMGVVSGNGSRLVGRDAVYQSFARLRGKHYLRRIEPRVNGRRVGPVRYEFYEWPAWNPDYTNPQVSDGSGNAGTRNPASNSPNRAKSLSSQVSDGSGNAGTRNPASRNPGNMSSQVSDGSGNAGSINQHPPTPPQEEVEPPPPTPSHRTGGLPSQREEGEGIRSARHSIEAAAEFLETLPGKWACGLKSTQELAPLLADLASKQGWDLDDALVAKLLEDQPDKVYSRKAFLKVRIEDLPRRAAAAASGDGQRCPYHPSRDAATCRPCAAGADRDLPAQAPGPVDPAAIKERLRKQIAAPERKKSRRRPTKRVIEAADRRAQEEFEQRRADAMRQLDALGSDEQL